ncbi:MAG: hypothetical protein FWE25_08310 [Lachnospiraceae bacterium]|nr:hypothetical protein [Lachnospiraceae bacterium]
MKEMMKKIKNMIRIVIKIIAITTVVKKGIVFLIGAWGILKIWIEFQNKRIKDES